MVPTVPAGQRGYRVNPDTGVVHLRYAEHAPNAVKVGTAAAVLRVLGGRDPSTCRICFPAKKAPARRSPSKKRA